MARRPDVFAGKGDPMKKKRSKSVVGWIKEDWLNMPPTSNIFIKRFYRRLLLFPKSCKYYKNINWKKVRITITELTNT